MPPIAVIDKMPDQLCDEDLNEAVSCIAFLMKMYPISFFASIMIYSS